MNKKTILSRVVFLIGVTAFIISCRLTGVNISQFIKRADHLTDLTSLMFPPDLSYSRQIIAPILQTIRMSIVGTTVGASCGLIAAPFCAANLEGNVILRGVLRILIQILRSFPALILALTATFLLGLGSFAGTSALAVFTFAIIGRLTYEDIEAAPIGAYRALIHIGSRKTPAFFRTILPAVLPSYLTNVLYLMETNVRASAIMGYVGAGGIGLLLNETISWREYERTGMILLFLFVTVCVMEAVSEFLIRVVRKEQTLPAFIQKCILILLTGVIIFSFFLQEGPDFSHTSIGIARNMASGLLHPDLSFISDITKTGLLFLLAETVCISFAGTVLGTLPALILAFLNTDRFIPKIPAVIFRILTMLIRSVPFIIYGLIFIRVTGAGAFAGVLTIGCCSIGLLTKRFTEAIEALDLRGYQALRCCGTAVFPALCRAVLPQLLPILGSQILYRFDVNIREAAILGFVGAGGIGATLILSMNKYAWTTAGAVFWGLVILVLIIDRISGNLRRKLYS